MASVVVGVVVDSVVGSVGVVGVVVVVDAVVGVVVVVVGVLVDTVEGVSQRSHTAMRGESQALSFHFPTP